ncbi:hypothetical protein C0J52_09936 [Blattella germanica]|nr:hypothetical protein C0J52_09936 [Blattella germanica]
MEDSEGAEMEEDKKELLPLLLENQMKDDMCNVKIKPEEVDEEVKPEEPLTECLGKSEDLPLCLPVFVKIEHQDHFVPDSEATNKTSEEWKTENTKRIEQRGAAENQSVLPNSSSVPKICANTVKVDFDKPLLFRNSFSCDLCGLSFRRKRDISKHMRTHDQLSCNVCGRSFSQRNYLKTHMLVHSPKQRSFVCNVCCKSFSKHSTLVTHMRMHTGERPFTCSVCGNLFTRKDSLKTHMGMHALKLSQKVDLSNEIVQ